MLCNTLGMIFRSRRGAGAPPVDTTPPKISSAVLNATTNAVDMTSDEAGTVFWAITGSATPPTQADIKAGTGATDFGSFSVTAGTAAHTISKAATPAGTRYLHLFEEDAAGNASATKTMQFTQPSGGDVTAPTLSAPVDAANGATASTAGVTTDEANGTLYVVVTTGATAPSAAQVKAGQDSAGAAAAYTGSQTVSAIGAQTISPAPSGLAASTAYTTHFMHEDAAGNQSAVVSASGFTTAAAGANPAVRASSSALQANGPDITIPIPAGVVAGDLLVASITGYIAHTITVPTGWTLHASTPVDQPTGLNRRMWVLTRVADGTEGASQTFAWTGGWAAAAGTIAAIQNYTSLGTALPETGGPGTTVTHTGISVSANSLLLVTYAVAVTLTEVTPGDLRQMALQGTSGNALLARAGVAAGTSPTLDATGASTYWASLALEVK